MKKIYHIDENSLDLENAKEIEKIKNFYRIEDYGTEEKNNIIQIREIHIYETGIVACYITSKISESGKKSLEEREKGVSKFSISSDFYQKHLIPVCEFCNIRII